MLDGIHIFHRNMTIQGTPTLYSIFLFLFLVINRDLNLTEVRPFKDLVTTEKFSSICTIHLKCYLFLFLCEYLLFLSFTSIFWHDLKIPMLQWRADKNEYFSRTHI